MIREESFLAIDRLGNFVVATPLYSLHYLESDDGDVDLGAGLPTYIKVEYEGGNIVLEHDKAVKFLDIFGAL